jgi:hypothetical protein
VTKLCQVSMQLGVEVVLKGPCHPGVRYSLPHLVCDREGYTPLPPVPFLLLPVLLVAFGVSSLA